MHAVTAEVPALFEKWAGAIIGYYIPVNKKADLGPLFQCVAKKG
jgi:hypothetical protein